jgi:hypothetical protein
MRIILFIFLFTGVNIFGQDISIEFKNMSIKSCLETLNEKYKANISFDQSMPEMSKTVNLNIKKSSIMQVLKSILKGTTLDFKQVGVNIVVFQKTTSMSDSDTKDLKMYTISGRVLDKSSGEALPGAYIQIIDNLQGIIANDYGFYTLRLSAGSHKVSISYLGYISQTEILNIGSNKEITFELEEDGIVMNEVVITEQKIKSEEHISNLQMSKLSVPMGLMSKVPTFLGESDIIKVFQLMPGVKRGGEGGTSMYVRGGASDENLVLLDEAPVYNAGHLLGFLSVFNTPALKKAEFYKGNADASFGGRLSSVLDVTMKDGNNKKFSGYGSISNIAANITLEGPIIDNKTSVIISGRRFYLDKIVDIFIKGLFPYNFYDFNIKLNHELNKNDRIYLSSYLGKDILDFGDALPADSISGNLNGNLGTDQGNKTRTFRWNHQYPNQRTFHNITLYTSDFNYNIKADAINNSFFINSSIKDIGAKFDVDYQANNARKIDYGIQYVFHRFNPSIYNSLKDKLEELPIEQKKIPNHEYNTYGSINQEFKKGLASTLGARISAINIYGKTFMQVEPRISLRKLLSKNHSIKASFAKNTQYVHLIQSSSVALPTDLWYPTTKNLPPAKSAQYSLGYFTNIGKTKDIQVSVEGYYKHMNNLVEYKEGAVLFFNKNIEDKLLLGKGKAYGAEILIQKNTGKLTGWIGYTWSKALRQFDKINNGKEFYAKYDRRHDLSVVSSYALTEKFDLNLVYVYSTGNPFTPITAKYLMPSPSLNGIDIMPIHAARNSYRLNYSSRLDFDLAFKKGKNNNLEFHMGAYNLLNRVQPSRVDVGLNKDGKLVYREKGILGFILSFGIKFKI